MRSTILTPSTTVTFLSNMTGIIFMSVVLAAIATRGTTALLVSSSVLSHNDEDYNRNQIDVYRNSSRRIGLVDPKEDDHDHHEKQQHHEEGYGHYTDQWAVHIEGGHGVADRIAAKHGFTNAGRIFGDHYHFVHRKIAKRSVERHHEFHQLLSAEPEVRWHEQQRVRRRSKRDLLQMQGSSKSGRGRTVKRSRVAAFNDPRWLAMWYLNRGPGLDMNVMDAWSEGITGKGIVVTILDDGLEKDHPDIVRNYDPMASFDVNSLDMDPMPTYDLTDSNRHGTRCAGEVAAEANNSICAVGVAFEASVGGVRMLDGDVTDAVEARSLSHNPQHIDIYSASWGPDDDGKTVDGPGELATRAFMEGVTKGRGGRGSIFVWASGNGGRDHDNCNCDGYTNSIWTLSISSATENGLVPWYSEACSSTLATTYSSGGTGEKQIVTIDLHHSCTSSHTGTSASAPLAAGICALALQANTNLTWRDMQHIVVRTARPQNLIASDWATNGVGRNVSHSFGYGLMDAGAMVKLAKSWKTVPEQNRCEVKAPYTDKNIPAKSKVTLDLKVTNCSGVNFLEHVQAKVTLTSGRRGDLQIYLVSPSGTRSTLLAHRRHDLNRAGFTDWPFMTVHSWGENPIGKWTLEIHNEGRYADHRNGRTVLKRWSLVVYGVEDDENDGGAKVQIQPAARAKQSQAEASSTITSAGGGGGAGPMRYPAHIDLSYLKNPTTKVLPPVVEGAKFNRSSIGSKSSSSGGGSSSGSVIEGASTASEARKASRQRVKSKLLAKKQKGISLPGGLAAIAITQKPATRLVTGNPELHHLARANSREDGNKLFSNFANQSQVNESTTSRTSSATTTGTMMRNVSREKENSLNSSSGIVGTDALRIVGGNSSSGGGSSGNRRDSITHHDDQASSSSSSSATLISSSPPTSPQAATRETGRVISLHEDSSGSDGRNTEAEVSSSSVTSSTDSQYKSTENSQGKLDTWTLVAHGLTHNPNDPPPAEGIGVAMPGAVGDTISLPTAPASAVPMKEGEVAKPEASSVSLESNPDSNLGQASVVGLESSDNSIVIQPSHAQKADIAVVPTASSSSSSSSACASVSNQGQCLDCSSQFVLFHGICISECPETFYPESRRRSGAVDVSSRRSGSPGAGSASTTTTSYICLPCHYSCKTCSGPNDYECLSCHNDENLHVKVGGGDESVLSRNESHCYPAALLESLNTNEFWYKTLLVTVIVNVVLVSLLLIYIWFQRRNTVDGRNPTSPIQRRSYHRISPEDDDPSTVLNVGDYDDEYYEDEDSDSEDVVRKLSSHHHDDERQVNFKNNLAAYVKSHNPLLPSTNDASVLYNNHRNNSNGGSIHESDTSCTQSKNGKT